MCYNAYNRKQLKKDHLMKLLAENKISDELYSDPDDIFTNLNLGDTSGFSTAFANSTISNFSVAASTFTSEGTVGTLSVSATQQTAINGGTEYVFEFDYAITITANPSTATFQFNIAEASSSTDIDISITNLSGTIRWTAISHTGATAHSYIVTLEARTTDTANPTTGNASFTDAIFGVAINEQDSETVLLGGTLDALVAVGNVGSTAITSPVNTKLEVFYADSSSNNFSSATYTSFYSKTFTAGETLAVDDEIFRFVPNSDKEVYMRFRVQSSTSATGNMNLQVASVKKN